MMKNLASNDVATRKVPERGTTASAMIAPTSLRLSVNLLVGLLFSASGTAYAQQSTHSGRPEGADSSARVAPSTAISLQSERPLALVSAVQAQTPPNEASAEENADANSLNEIVVVGTKRAGGETVQHAPVAVTAFGEEQVEAMHLRDISAVGFQVPNVTMEGTGSAKGVANFSIRGQGITSSIASIDPTVGTFIDGIYLGVNFGVVFDTFDLEGIEVLRGPQGLLFGRNVTGGAVLLRTTDPSPEFDYSARAAIESGPDYILSGRVTGPLNAAGTISAKIAAYYSNDKGWFTNDATGLPFGKEKSLVLRGGLGFHPTSNFDLILKYDRGRFNGDGVVPQNHFYYSQNSHNFAVSPGTFNETKSDQLTAQLNWRLGRGELTNIAGWRKVSNFSLSDPDGTPETLFHLTIGIEQEQFSNELRYSGNYGPVEATVGLFYFEQKIRQVENIYRPTIGFDSLGGGALNLKTWAVFSQFNIALSDAFSAIVGIRYSKEDKSANVDVFRPRALSTCMFSSTSCASYAFEDSDSWSSLIPKIGIEWEPAENTNVYAFWTKGFRSGGYSLRQTNPNVPPGPFDQEHQNSYEVGVKRVWGHNFLTTNLAVFYNQLSDIQRDVIIPHPLFGTIQTTTNTADGWTKGFEAEILFNPTKGLSLGANVGYVDSKYTKVLYDISGDGVVNDLDYNLVLPRLSPWGYGANVSYEGSLTSAASFHTRLSYNHRDSQFSNDANTGVLPNLDLVDASFGVGLNSDRVSVNAYVRNLLNDVSFGLNTITNIPGPGGTFSPLNKGRVLGLELVLKY